MAHLVRDLRFDCEIPRYEIKLVGNLGVGFDSAIYCAKRSRQIIYTFISLGQQPAFESHLHGARRIGAFQAERPAVQRLLPRRDPAQRLAAARQFDPPSAAIGFQFLEEILSDRRCWYRPEMLGRKRGLWALKSDVAEYYAFRRKASVISGQETAIVDGAQSWA